MRKFVLTSSMVLLSACSFAPKYQQAQLGMPDSYHATQANLPQQVQHIEPRWWLSYNDPVLDQMIEQAFAYNHDLGVAIAQMDDAAAQARIARNSMLPSVNASGSGARAQTSNYSSGLGALGNSYSVGASLSWELDLWGRLRNSNKVAVSSYLASTYNQEAVRLSIAALVAQTYFQLLAADSSLKLAQETEQSRKETFNIQTQSFNAGNLSMLEVDQARSEWDSARLSVEQQALAVKTTEAALSVLLGQTPSEFLQGHPRGLALNSVIAPKNIPIGLPSDILLRRPDVAAAEQSLIAANANIGVARAAYFPSIGLTGNLGSQSYGLSKLFTGAAGTWSFVGNLAAPIFNFGSTQANVNSANARQRQALENYQKTVQTSFQDVLNSLRTTESMQVQSTIQRDQVKTSKEALHLAQLRYDNGYSGYLDLLDTQRNNFAVQMQAINTQLNYLNATINLYKALGGG